MIKLLQPFEERSGTALVLVSLGFLLAIGLVDYLTGFDISFSVFYLLGICFATWFVSRRFGFVMSALSVITWVAGDWAAGARYPNLFVPIWNALILTVFYFVVVWLLANMRASHIDLETKVRLRTAALTHEITERERLEKVILEVSEREQQRIGHDLHDSLCQHWAATAMAGQVLGEKLSARELPEAADAREVVKLVEDGITLTRNLAHGISPLELEAGGLVSAFQEFAANVSRIFKTPCQFDCQLLSPVEDATTGTHLYRIAQEAVNNAIRHGKPKQIFITLSQHRDRLELTIEDDGSGLPEDWQRKRGLGARIMAHRATMIGGDLSIEPNPTGGTLVRCSLPAPAAKPADATP